MGGRVFLHRQVLATTVDPADRYLAKSFCPKNKRHNMIILAP